MPISHLIPSIISSRLFSQRQYFKMPDKLTLPRFLKVAYTSLDAGPEPYNEEYSTKHLLESSSNSSSTDELPPYRPRRSINLLGKFFIAANVLLFLVSAFLLFFSTRLARSTIVSGDLEDKFNNSLIKLHSGPCKIRLCHPPPICTLTPE